MFKEKMWCVFLLICVATRVVADNNFTFTGTPVAGQPFTITWTPGTYTKVDIMLNNLPFSGMDIITTSDAIATEIDNTGSWVWNVPADIQGRYSLSISRDYRFPVSYSVPFVFGPYSFTTPPPETSIPQSTACTSAVSSIPSPTGVNPFIFPSGDAFHVRVGVQSTIKWIPTTSGTISIVLQPGGYDTATTKIPIASKIPNSGSYSWTPSNDLANNGFPLFSYWIVLVDDENPEITSTSEKVEVLSPTYETDFIGPYVPAVLGRPFRINWSPSTTPTISLVLQEAIPVRPEPNITIGDHIQNSGSYTWQVPSSSDFVVPGVWVLAAVDDATGNIDAQLQITIDATEPPTCGPDSSNDSAITNLFPPASTTGQGSAASPATTNASVVAASTAARPSITILNSVATAASDLSPSASMSMSGARTLRPASLLNVLGCALFGTWLGVSLRMTAL